MTKMQSSQKDINQLKEETLKKKKKETIIQKQKQVSCVRPKFCGTLGAEGIQKRKIKECCHGQGKTAKERIFRFLQWGGAAGRLSHTFP